MSKKYYPFMALALVVATIFSACSRSASQAPIATSTQRAQGPLGSQNTGATNDPMAMVKMFATQTALAAGGQTQATPTTIGGTPLPWGTPATPAPTTTGLPPTGIPITPTIGTPYPTPTRPVTYTLQEGEYPYCIARRYNVDQTELMALNGITNQILQPGYVLKIPQTGNPFVGKRVLHPHPVIYLVVANDTVYKIGCYFGDVDPLAIIAVNNLVSPYKLNVGQNLNIP